MNKIYDWTRRSMNWYEIHNLKYHRENDGDLESDVNPLKTPEGNYNIAWVEDVAVLNRDTFAYFVKPKVRIKMKV